MYFFDLADRRRTRSVDLYNEIFKKTAAAEKASYRKIFGKTGHSLEEIAKH